VSSPAAPPPSRSRKSNGSATARYGFPVRFLETFNYFALANYVSNWKRMGFTEADLTRPGSDKFIDTLVAYGTPDDIADRLGEHLRAGADHVVIQVLGGPDKLLPTLCELAGALGLTPRP
jgi:alkanesulfonate monooxygenase SsuD/methylene tetrahydromethanopterin reductase-like flavin-dependent oxidoreductase (luciferase family)